MNKVLLIIKNILLLILTAFVVKYTIIFGVYGITYISYLVLLGLLILFSITDIIKKRDIALNKTYNIISIVMLLIMIFVFARTLFDQNFLFNSSKYIIEEEASDIYDGLHMYIALYLYQNLRYFIVMMLAILLYRKLNMKKEEHKYHIVSIICLLISICTIIPSLECLYNNLWDTLKYLLFTLVLIGVEVYRLIKDNHKKREWVIILSFIFNTFALVTIFVSLFLL